MEERFCGLIFAMVMASLPDFGPIFERYAGDLKRVKPSERADRNAERFAFTAILQ